MNIVKFEGAWRDRDQRIVHRAVAQAEESMNLDTPESLIGEPWLCQYEVDYGQPRYLARRVNLDYDFTGETLAEFVEDLIMMAGEKRRQAPLAPYWSPPEFRTHRAGQ